MKNSMLRSSKSEHSVLTRMQSRALFPFVVALYMPVRQKDNPFDYNDFYRASFGHSGSYLPSEDNSIDLLIRAQNATYSKKELPEVFILPDYTNQAEGGINEKRLKDLQYFHTLQVGGFFKDYVELLRLIRNKLGDFAEFDLKKIEERSIPTRLPNVPIIIFDKGRLVQIHQVEETKIIEEMTGSSNWADSLGAIKSLISDVTNPRLGHLRRYRVLSTDPQFTPVSLDSAPEREDIIGIDENLQRLEALVRGYAKGRSTPNIVLLGPGGVGKTTSLRYVMEVTRDVEKLRYFLMDSLENIKQLADLSNRYRPIGVIDDMMWEVNPKVYAHLKQQLEGLGSTLSDRVLIIISANQEIWDNLPCSVRQRLGGVELNYQPNPESYGRLVERLCAKFDVNYDPQIIDEVTAMVPRQVRDYIRALGSELAGLETTPISPK